MITEVQLPQRLASTVRPSHSRVGTACRASRRLPRRCGQVHANRRAMPHLQPGGQRRGPVVELVVYPVREVLDEPGETGIYRFAPEACRNVSPGFTMASRRAGAHHGLGPDTLSQTVPGCAEGSSRVGVTGPSPTRPGPSCRLRQEGRARGPAVSIFKSPGS